jgi:GAF domain
MIATKEVQQCTDIRREQTYIERSEPGLTALADKAGARSLVTVPMVKDEALVGAIAIYRQEVRPFTDKHIELVKSFAAQAVILRTLACSTNCENHCSSRPLPPTCSRSSAVRHSICRPSSIRWSPRRRDCARPTAHRSIGLSTTPIHASRAMGIRVNSNNICAIIPSSRAEDRSWAAP